MSFRNRCVVAGSNGLVNLSVPVEKGRGQKELMKDVRISYRENWQTQHWRTIESCYARAPFFEFYGEAVRSLIHSKHSHLLDLDLAILEWVMKVGRCSNRVSLTEAYERAAPEGVADWRGKFLPRHYQQEDPGLRYTQVFEDRIGFVSNLSVLDLLFCCGPEAGYMLRSPMA